MISTKWMKACGTTLVLAACLGSAAHCEQALSGSEARRAALCAGDYVCDEDGSWAIADIAPDERTLHMSEHRIERLIAEGKVVSPPAASRQAAQRPGSD